MLSPICPNTTLPLADDMLFVTAFVPATVPFVLIIVVVLFDVLALVPFLKF